MKKNISLILGVILTFSLFFFGCDNNSSKNDYVVNNDGIVNVGVLLPLSGDEKNIGDSISEGLNYAFELAPGVNIDNGKKHLINLIYKDVNQDIESACEDFKENNVAAVICYATKGEVSEAILSSFKKESTALLFANCNSDSILTSNNALSIDIPLSYQTSVASSYFIENGFKAGAVVSPGNDYGKKFANLFKESFISGGGNSVSVYQYNCEDANFNANTIAGSELEFVFLVGSQNDTAKLYLEIKNAGAEVPVVLSEVFDKTSLEDKMFNDVMYISKFEQDDDNYIGTDFIKSFSKSKGVSTTDITTAEAYGYDAYMLLYGALMSFNTSSNSFSSENNSDDTINSTSVQLLASQVLTSLKSTAHMGVTDSVTFADNGTVSTNFLYLGAIQNGNAITLNKYNYNHETK